ncbi:hypothetical protein [Halomicrobium salinisoli]|uniref:hypothetical protein n=1 Tax=Halomicrobium salinisoli TaxID=2878391 RepID=UPI001CF0315F|nr:hypothetical protein [Halomicrobium salinisoli]
MLDAIDVDDVRLSDLSLEGWIGLGTGTAGVAGVGYTVITWAATGGDVLGGLLLGGVAVLLGTMLAYENGRPECDVACDNCGQHVRSHSSRDGVDEYVEVYASGSPRRISIGPFSIVAERREIDHVYCSGECADEDTRVLLDKHDHDTVPATAGVEDAQ